jgi:hypothetical protein
MSVVGAPGGAPGGAVVRTADPSQILKLLLE